MEQESVRVRRLHTLYSADEFTINRKKGHSPVSIKEKRNDESDTSDKGREARIAAMCERVACLCRPDGTPLTEDEKGELARDMRVPLAELAAILGGDFLEGVQPD